MKSSLFSPDQGVKLSLQDLARTKAVQWALDNAPQGRPLTREHLRQCNRHVRSVLSQQLGVEFRELPAGLPRTVQRALVNAHRFMNRESLTHATAESIEDVINVVGEIEMDPMLSGPLAELKSRNPKFLSSICHSAATGALPCLPSVLQDLLQKLILAAGDAYRDADRHGCGFVTDEEILAVFQQQIVSRGSELPRTVLESRNHSPAR